MPTANKLSLYLTTIIFMFLVSYWLVPFTGFWEHHSVSASGELKRGVQYEQAGKYPQAFKWYERAANAGDVSAQFKLANLYEQGQGTEQNPALALEWYQRAAQAGYLPAQEKLQQLQTQTEHPPVHSLATMSKEISQPLPANDSQNEIVKEIPLPDQEDENNQELQPVVNEEEKEDQPPVAKEESSTEILPTEKQINSLRYLYAQGRYPEVIIQGSAIADPSPPIKLIVKQAEQVQTAWVKVSHLMDAGEFQAAYHLARLYNEPELQKLALRAKRQLEIALKELEYLFIKGDYATVISRGESKNKDHPEVKKWVKHAKEIEAQRAKIIQLMSAGQLPTAYQLANSMKDSPFQELTIDIKGQINRTEAEFAYLLAQGQYQQVITQGTTKITWSRTMKDLVKQAQAQLALAQKAPITEEKLAKSPAIEEQPAHSEKVVEPAKITEIPPDEKPELPSNSEVVEKPTAIAAVEKADAVKPISIAVIGDSLADGIWGGVYRLLRKDQRFKVYRETVTASGLVRYDWINRVRKLLEQKDIDIAIVLMGTNDGQALSEGKQRYSYQSEGWKTAYTQRVHQLMNLLAEHHVATFWVGLPTMRRDSLGKQAVLLNQLYQERAGNFEKIHFLSTTQLTAGETGGYSAYLVDSSGRKKLLRTNDGVHFTMGGYDLLARYIIENIYRNVPALQKEAKESHDS